MKLTLIDNRPEAGDVATLVFRPEHPINWQAGQYLHYILPHDNADDRGDERWFTISSAPFEANIQISTRFFAKPSSFKSHLHDLAIGQTIEAGEPEGDFVVTNPSLRYVFIAGGIGITPIRSILAQADHDGQQLDVELLYGNRDQDSTVFAAELATFARRNPKLKLHNVLEPKRIDAELIKSLPDYAVRTYYVSGPKPMVEAMAKLLTDLGIAPDQQKHDDFPGYE